MATSTVRPKSRTSRKSPIVQQAVIANAMLGKPKSQIAQELSIHRDTVTAILSSAEIQQQVEIARSECVRRIPKSIRVIDTRLEKGSETAALAILRGTGVLQSNPTVVNNNNIAANMYMALLHSDTSADTPVEPSTITVDSAVQPDPPALLAPSPDLDKP